MGVLENLRAQREKAFSEAKAVADKAAAENRNFTAVEQAVYDSRSAELDRLDERIKSVAEGEQRAQAAAGVMDPYLSRRRRPEDGQLMDAFRSAILERNPAPIVVEPGPGERTMRQPGLERRDLVSTAPANMSPVSFHSRIVETLVDETAVLRAGAMVLNTSGGEELRVPRSTGDSTVGIVAEAAAIPESDPTLGSVSLGAHKYGCLISVSSELVQDAGFDLEGYLARETGRAISQALGNHLINGTGTGQPRGVLADATVGVTGAPSSGYGTQGSADQGTDLFYDLHASLAEPYVRQSSTAWLMRNASLAEVRKFKDTAGDPVNFVQDERMIGLPAFADPHVPAIAASAKSVIFGDWSRFFVRMAGGIRFERSDEYAFNTDMVTFRALLRADSALIDPSAIKVLQHAAV